MVIQQMWGGGLKMWLFYNGKNVKKNLGSIRYKTHPMPHGKPLQPLPF